MHSAIRIDLICVRYLELILQHLVASFLKKSVKKCLEFKFICIYLLEEIPASKSNPKITAIASTTASTIARISHAAIAHAL